MKPPVVLIAALLMCPVALAQKTYTASELQRMVSSGSPPKQSAASTRSEASSFAACVAKIDALVASVGASYPTVTVLDTASSRIEKLWTNDAAMTVTCSAADRKITITTARYQ